MKPIPQVFAVLAVGPRPPERRCRSGRRGRGWERPPYSACLIRHRRGLGCTLPSQPRLGSLPVQQSRAGRQRRAGRPVPCRRRDSVGAGAPGRARRSSRWIGPPAGRDGKGTRPRREERTESVPEAGGTGAEAVATPTTLPAGHSANSAGKPRAEHPATGRPREPSDLPTANAAGAGFVPGIEGGGAPLASPRLYRGYAERPRLKLRQEIA